MSLPAVNKTRSTVKVRESSNADLATPLTVNERILRECHTLYADPGKGLIHIGEQFDIKLSLPRKKITILLIGNHSAGKSSFINWYIEEHVQKTGVAIETQGFVIVTSGKRRESLMGNATLHLFPHLKPLQEIQGVLDFLSTEISTSKQKKFSLVTFIDTPGLVDGDLQYPFDVNETILWLGGIADLIFVFFDPIGQALCKRTLFLVEKLNSVHTDKMRFYLSKADDAGNEADRQKVMMQIVQELCKRPGLNRTGFDMPTIFIPDINAKPTRCVNQIDDVCKEIERTINRAIQNTINTLEKDANTLEEQINLRLKLDDESRNYNFKASSRALFMAFVACILPLLLVVNYFLMLIGADTLASVFGTSVAASITKYMTPVRAMWSLVPEGKQWQALFTLLAGSVITFFMIRWSLGLKPTLTRKRRHQFIDMLTYIKDTVKSKKERLYREYLGQSVGDHDL